MQLSQFCSELVERFQHDKVNSDEIPVAEKLRSQLDDVTQTWDSIIGRLEEHSRAVGEGSSEREDDWKRKYIFSWLVLLKRVQIGELARRRRPRR